MAKPRLSEQRARQVTRDLLLFRGWNVKPVSSGGQLLEENEYKGFATLAQLFKQKSKTGPGDGKPDFLLVNDAIGIRPVLVIETKPSVSQSLASITEAIQYGDACVASGHDVLAVGIAGAEKEICTVAVKRFVGHEWKSLTLAGAAIDWIPSPAQVQAILAVPNRVEVEPERPSEEVLSGQAQRLNEILRECKVKDEFRPVYAATFMLALWQGDVSIDDKVVLRQIVAAHDRPRKSGLRISGHDDRVILDRVFLTVLTA